MQNHKKEQQNLRLVLQNEETQLLTDQQRENERKMYELRQEISRAETDKEQDEIQAATKKEQSIQHAQGDASAQITTAEGQKSRIVSEIKGKTVTEINNAKANSNKLQIQTDQEVAVMGINAQTEYAKCKAKYEALVQECDAEKTNLDAINAQREHEYQMNKAEAYRELSSG